MSSFYLKKKCIYRLNIIKICCNPVWNPLVSLCVLIHDKTTWRTTTHIYFSSLQITCNHSSQKVIEKMSKYCKYFLKDISPIIETLIGSECVCDRIPCRQCNLTRIQLPQKTQRESYKTFRNRKYSIYQRSVSRYCFSPCLCASVSKIFFNYRHSPCYYV